MQLSEKFADKSAIVCIVGLGYVGLPTAVSFAEKGFKVIGADKKSQVVDLINKGCCHLKDLNLDERVKKVGLKACADFSLAYCPERYNPGDSGHTIADVVRVIGAITSQ